MQPTAVIYARVSSVGERQSTARQVEDLTEYALCKGLKVLRTFEEHASGAKRNSERPLLLEALEFCRQNGVGMLLVSELSRIGRNAFEVLSTIKSLMDAGVNLYIQREQFSLLDAEGKPSLFAPILLATLSTCAQLEREGITFRLQSGRRRFVGQGGKLGRKKGSVKTDKQKREEYAQVITLLKKGYSIRDVAKLSGRGVSTVQRVKKIM